jgi:hypothetical protein
VTAKVGRKPVTEAALKPPRKIAAEEFNELLDVYSIQGSERDKLKHLVDELIAHFQDRARQQSKNRTKAQDRRSINLAAKRILQAKNELRRCGAEGRQLLRFAAGEHLSTTFSLHWLMTHFPGDEMLPDDPTDRPQRGGRSPTRLPLRGRQVGTGADTFQALYYFARQKGPDIIGAALKEIYESLVRSYEQTKSRGGRKPTYTRHYFLVNLALIWKRIGRSWSGESVPMEIAGKRSHFQSLNFNSFCDSIFRLIGWPVQGLDDAIKRAIKDVNTKRLA